MRKEKTYVGTAFGTIRGGVQDCHVVIEQNGKQRPLPPDDFFWWGDSGRRSTFLAEALIQDFMGRKPGSWMYERFRDEVVAKWPLHLGECWRLPESELQDYLFRIMGL